MPAVGRYNELEVLTRISMGSEKAFALFYENYHSDLAARIMRILKNREQAEEVLQDVFSKIWLRRESIMEIEDIQAFLYVSARNGCLNQLKANIRKEALEKSYFNEQDMAYSLPPLDTLSLDDYYDKLIEAVDKLPSQQKKVYVLSRVDRKKYLEIAEELGISKETVKKYLQLANQSIKSQLSGHRDSMVSLLLFFLFF